MVWYFIGVYIINRTLHGRLEIRNFSSRVEKNISWVSAAKEWNIFQHSKRNFISRHGHVISSIYFILYSLFLTLSRVKYLGLTIKRDHRKLFLALNRITKEMAHFLLRKIGSPPPPLWDKILRPSFYKLCFL